MTTRDAQSASPRHAVPIPIILCPECGHREPGAFVAQRSGAVVKLSGRHFKDERGYLHCRACSVVWPNLPIAAADSREESAPAWADGLFAYDRLGVSAFFRAKDAPKSGRFRALARRSMEETSRLLYGNTAIVGRTRDRLNDSDGYCAFLGLPKQVQAAVAAHLTTLSLKGDWRSFRKGTLRPRQEAITIAVIEYVCDVFNVGADPTRLLPLVRFPDSPNPTLTRDEFELALLHVRAFFNRVP